MSPQFTSHDLFSFVGVSLSILRISGPPQLFLAGGCKTRICPAEAFHSVTLSSQGLQPPTTGHVRERQSFRFGNQAKPSCYAEYRHMSGIAWWITTMLVRS